MRYLKASLLPGVAAVTFSVALAQLHLLAVMHYFAEGAWPGFGDLLWNTSLSSYTFNGTVSVAILAAALWAGYRAAGIGPHWFAPISSGAIVTAVFAAFWTVVLLINREETGPLELDRVASKFGVMFILAMMFGGIGGWLRVRRGNAT